MWCDGSDHHLSNSQQGYNIIIRHELSSIKRTLITVIHHIVQCHFTIERIPQLFHVPLDPRDIKSRRQGRRRRGHTLHLEQDRTAVGRNLLIRGHLINRETGLGQGGRDFVDNSGVVGASECKVGRV